MNSISRRAVYRRQRRLLKVASNTGEAPEIRKAILRDLDRAVANIVSVEGREAVEFLLNVRQRNGAFHSALNIARNFRIAQAPARGFMKNADLFFICYEIHEILPKDQGNRYAKAIFFVNSYFANEIKSLKTQGEYSLEPVLRRA